MDENRSRRPAKGLFIWGEPTRLGGLGPLKEIVIAEARNAFE